MRLADLSPRIIEGVKQLRYDRFIEKHEGPEDWRGEFQWRDLEFIDVAGYDILLPVDKKHHPHITILRHVLSQDGRTLVLFLKDKTFLEDDADSSWENFTTGRVAICEKFRDENFYVSTFFHEWIVIENQIFD